MHGFYFISFYASKNLDNTSVNGLNQQSSNDSIYSIKLNTNVLVKIVNKFT